jgi:hypothetical protein
MPLKNTIISQFIKNTKDDSKSKKQETIMYGRLSPNDPNSVILDGSEFGLPVAHFTTKVNPNERVIVMIKNHSAIVTGNITSQATTTAYVDDKIQEITLPSPIEAATIDQLWSGYNK